MDQLALFGDAASADAAALPEGAVYEPDFLDAAQEQQLIDVIRSLPLAHATYKSYTARRRVLSFGGSFDYDANRLRPGEPLIESLHPLRARVAAWMGVEPEALAHVLVAEYQPGTPLGWHRDVPDFEDVAGVSLGADAVLRFRPWPPTNPKRANVLKLLAQRRSIYALRGPARWAWQHSVAPVAEWRWSITLRTLRRP
ncbi:alpha-ketoglutarate-dependent dioxygenase AlkB [Ideonella sp. YS5]|uniref:alpha-ketoglutarate-dependent dioxygenase AlkB n=1 Tax=Ideonella sp. YS5 TaxID=3453714 RepID=UPI003EF03BEF